MHLSLTSKGEKYGAFCKERGLTYDQLTKMMARDNLGPGICTNVGCDFTCEEIESDQESGYCEKCGNQTLVSILVLSELIV